MTVSIEKSKKFLEEKKEKVQKELDKKYACALRDFENIKKMIIENYNPKRIYQWGSLLDRGKFKDYSDIDIAVEGIDDAETFFKMYGNAEKLTDFSLDLLDINKIEPEFADLIKIKGKVVYER